MPPQKRIFKQDILDAAVRLVREKGPQSISVRNLAKEMNCSTQPIYSVFDNMETLTDELIAFVRENYLCIDASNYKQFALSFLCFAKNEKNLFRLIYLRHREENETLFEDPNQAKTVRKLLSRLKMI